MLRDMQTRLCKIGMAIAPNDCINEKTEKFTKELQVRPREASLGLPHLVAVYTVNTLTAQGAVARGKDEIKPGIWWDGHTTLAVKFY